MEKKKEKTTNSRTLFKRDRRGEKSHLKANRRVERAIFVSRRKKFEPLNSAKISFGGSFCCFQITNKIALREAISSDTHTSTTPSPTTLIVDR